uniref:Uncharacterized protein n=1 Tax=Oryza glaberrima TaxID=4538 RepID=I1P8G7_ORYGL
MAGTAAQPGRVLRSSPAFEQMGIDGSWRCRSASGSLSLGLGELAAEKHVRYIVTVEKVGRLSLGCELLDAAADSDWMLFAAAAAVMQKDSFESLVMEHIRVNGAYWGLTTLDLLHKLHAVEADEFIGWIMSCYHPDSGSARRGGGGID